MLILQHQSRIHFHCLSTITWTDSVSRMQDLDHMFRLGLYINDLSIHDSSRELLLAGTQQSAELKLLLDQVRNWLHKPYTLSLCFMSCAISVTFLLLPYADQRQGYAEIGLLSCLVSLSQDESIGDSLLAPVWSIEKITLAHIWSWTYLVSQYLVQKITISEKFILPIQTDLSCLFYCILLIGTDQEQDSRRIYA